MESHSGINWRRFAFFDANFEQVMNWLLLQNGLPTKIYPGLSSDVHIITNLRHLRDVSRSWICAEYDLRL